MKAIWNNQIIAESENTIVIERNHYFPSESIKPEFFIDSEKQSRCFWKGVANYKHLSVDGEINQDAAWYYPEPKGKAKSIKGYFAFWRGVAVIE